MATTYASQKNRNDQSFSELDKMLLQLAKNINDLSKNAVTDPQFKKAVNEGAVYLGAVLQSDYQKADPTGSGAGRIKIQVGAFPGKPRKRNMYRVIIGPNYRTSQGWRLWHLFNYGYSKKTKDGSDVIVPGKKVLQSAMARGGATAVQIIGLNINKFLEKNLKKHLGNY